jgi:tetratricopeptide (TPR) repeat protein
MIRKPVAVCSVLVVSALAAPGLSQPLSSAEEQWTRCKDVDGELSADVEISSCTGLIESGKLDSASRAAALESRGIAYASSGNPKRAIADLSEAIRLKQDYAEAFLNRGTAYLRFG